MDYTIEKFRYLFDVDEDNVEIVYGSLINTKIVFDDGKDYSNHAIYDVHKCLFQDDNGVDIYEGDYIHINRQDSLKPHISQVLRGYNGGAYIYHETIEQLTGNGYEPADYWSDTQNKNVVLHKRYEE